MAQITDGEVKYDDDTELISVNEVHTFKTAIWGYAYSAAVSSSFKRLLGDSAPPTKRHFCYPEAILKAVH